MYFLFVALLTLVIDYFYARSQTDWVKAFVHGSTTCWLVSSIIIGRIIIIITAFTSSQRKLSGGGDLERGRSVNPRTVFPFGPGLLRAIQPIVTSFLCGPSNGNNNQDQDQSSDNDNNDNNTVVPSPYAVGGASDDDDYDDSNDYDNNDSNDNNDDGHS
jgi:hypothetical protein